MSRPVGPELLTEQHVLEGFDCGDRALNSWLAGRAPPATIETLRDAPRL